MARKFSEDDLYALLEYIGSNPAILFPNLTEAEKKDLIERVLDQLDDLEKGGSTTTVIDLLKTDAKRYRK